VRDVRWRIFEESSHLPHIEETEAFLAEVRAFFETVDSTADAGVTAAL
jgi:L-proline amide hydrolase